MHDDFSATFPGLAVHDLLDAIPHGIAVVDRELRIVAVNSQIEALTGLALAEVRGVYVDFVLRSSIGSRGRIFREVLESGAAQVLDGDIVSRDRRKLPMQFTISPLRSETDEPLGLVIVLDDLSAMAASASQLSTMHSTQRYEPNAYYLDPDNSNHY